MVSAMIFAGGVGERMKSADIPKQFLEIEGKPIIIRTLEHFSNHSEVDAIVISCIESWIDVLKEQIKKFNISKVVDIVPGGSNGHESIHNGLVRVQEYSKPEDLVLICDGVRPILTEELISTCIADTRKYQSAVPVTPSIDSVLYSEDGVMCGKSFVRSTTYITQAPQGYTMEKIMWAHAEAKRRNIDSPTSSSELLIELGEQVHIFTGIRDNIKVTTPEDLHVLRATEYYTHFKNFAKEELKYGI